MSAPIRGGRAKPVKESFFVRVEVPGTEAGQFFNASAYIGKEMPYSKPLSTCAMRVDKGVIGFSVLQLTKNTAKTVAAKAITIPRGALKRLSEQAERLELAENEIKLEMDDSFVTFNYQVDENGQVTIETAPGQDEVTFELAPRGAKISVYLRSPKVERVLAISYIGFLGRPGTTETATRAAGMILNSLLPLSEFRVLTGMERVKVAAAPRSWINKPSVRKDEDRVVVEIAVNMVTSDMAPVASGPVVIEVDLENAAPMSGHLLYNLTPSEAITETFASYKDTVTAALHRALADALGDDLGQITYEIILDEVDSRTIERLRSALDTLVSIDVTPDVFRLNRREAAPAS